MKGNRKMFRNRKVNTKRNNNLKAVFASWEWTSD